MCDGDGVRLALDATERYFSDATVVTATAGLLRQLAKSDDVKVALVREGALVRIHAMLDAHKASSRVITQVGLDLPQSSAELERRSLPSFTRVTLDGCLP